MDTRPSIIKLSKLITKGEKKKIFVDLFNSVKREDNTQKMFTLTTIMPGGVVAPTRAYYSDEAPHIEGFSLYDFARANGFRKACEVNSSIHKGTLGEENAYSI